MKHLNKIHIASTVLFSLMLLGGVGMYFFNYEEVVKAYNALGYPTYLIYPLATLKALGVFAIWWKKTRILTDLAYSGFFWNLLLAVSAHVNVGDGEWMGAAVAFVMLVISYTTHRLQEDQKA